MRHTWTAVSVLLVSLALGLAQAQPAQRAFPTMAALRAATSLAPDESVTLRGYYQPGDDGGGTFRYDPKSEVPPDDGSAVALDKLPGRLRRVVEPDADVYAEWFGAHGDGDRPDPHADQTAINQCLAAYHRVKFLAKTYGVRGTPTAHNPAFTFHAVDLGPNYRISGSGREVSRLKLLDGTNPPGGGPGDNYFIMLYNRDFHESADNLVLRDFTIDCNFDHQDKRTTIHALAIRGGGALVERLNLRGYGTGRHPETGSSRECFAVHQTLCYKNAQASRRAAVMRDLDFTGCGHNGDVPGQVAEITHLALGGADNFENKGWILPQGKDPAFDPAEGGENERNWWPSYGGLVENVRIHDEVYDPATQKSPLNGITYGDCVGLTIRGNRVDDFEGTAIFTMSWWNRNTVIVDNQFRKVTNGLVLLLAAEGGKPIQCPRHEDVLFAGNEIVLGAHRHAPYGTTGVTFFGGDMPNEIRMRGLHVRENRISGRAYTNAAGGKVAPLGLKLQILRPTYDDIRFEDNVLDLPDYNPGVWVPQEPYSLSLFYFPLAMFREAVDQGRVLYRNNRTPEGKLLYPVLTDWYFKNGPTYGKP